MSGRSGAGTQVSPPQKAAPLSHKAWQMVWKTEKDGVGLRKRGQHSEQQSGGLRFQPQICPSSCDQGRSLSHTGSQFLQLYNELLDPLWLPHTEFCDQVLTGGASAFYGGNKKKCPQKGQQQRKAMVLGRRQKEPPLPCWVLEELHPENTAQPSPAQMLAQPLCWNKDSA